MPTHHGKMSVACQLIFGIGINLSVAFMCDVTWFGMDIKLSIAAMIPLDANFFCCSL